MTSRCINWPQCVKSSLRLNLGPSHDLGGLCPPAPVWNHYWLYERNTWFRFLRDFVPSSTGALPSTAIHLIERSPRAMHKTVGGTTAVTAALTITTVVCSKHATTINDTNYTANENKLHCSKITKRINSKPSVVQISMLSSLNYGAVSKKTRTAMFRTLRRSMQALRYLETFLSVTCHCVYM